MTPTPGASLTDGDLAANTKYSTGLAHSYLASIGITTRGRKPPTAPYSTPLLCEVTAIARIKQWDRARIKDQIDPTLPTAADALADLNRRYVADPESVSNGEPVLFRRVFFAWSRRCSPSAVAMLGADVVCPNPPADQIDDLLSVLLDFVN